MDEYSFQEGIPVDFQPDFDLGIFHQQQHLYLQSPQGWNSFVLLDNVRKRIGGLIHFHSDGPLAESPFRAPFGSYIFSPKISVKEIKHFVEFSEMKLKAKGVNTLILKNQPEAYSPDQIEMLRWVFTEGGYKVQQEEISAIIPITTNSFESQVHRSEKKKLRKCRESKLVFKRVSLDHLPLIYGFLEKCRLAKGYSLSMTLEALTKTSDLFPEYFFLTQVTLDNTLIAANISIRVKEFVLYNFYHDHDRSFDALSPVVFLNEGLYSICQENGFVLLDLGTSTLNGELNNPLLTFKLRLGAQPSRKLTFMKKLL